MCTVGMNDEIIRRNEWVLCKQGWCHLSHTWQVIADVQKSYPRHGVGVRKGQKMAWKEVATEWVRVSRGCGVGVCAVEKVKLCNDRNWTEEMAGGCQIWCRSFYLVLLRMSVEAWGSLSRHTAGLILYFQWGPHKGSATICHQIVGADGTVEVGVFLETLGKRGSTFVWTLNTFSKLLW